jgi:hypothetical protein
MLSAIIDILCKIKPQGLGAWIAVGVKSSLTFQNVPHLWASLIEKYEANVLVNGNMGRA